MRHASCCSRRPPATRPGVRRRGATRLGVELRVRDRPLRQLDDPWRDRAIAVRFHEPSVVARVLVARVAGTPVRWRARRRRSAGRSGGARGASASACRGTRRRRSTCQPQQAADPRSDFAPPACRCRAFEAVCRAGRERPRWPRACDCFRASSSRSALRQPRRDPRRHARGVRARARSRAHAARAPDVRALRDPEARRSSSSEFIEGASSRSKACSTRRAARVRDLRQARSARRSVLRGDDLRHAVARSGARPGCDRRGDRARRCAHSASPRPDPRRMPRRPAGVSCSKSRRGRSAGCARSAVAVRRSAGERRCRSRSCCCATRSARTSRAVDREQGCRGVMMIPIPADAGSTEGVEGMDGGARRAACRRTCGSPRRPISCSSRCRRGQLSGVHLRARRQRRRG